MLLLVNCLVFIDIWISFYLRQPQGSGIIEANDWVLTKLFFSQMQQLLFDKVQQSDGGIFISGNFNVRGSLIDLYNKFCKPFTSKTPR